MFFLPQTCPEIAGMRIIMHRIYRYDINQDSFYCISLSLNQLIWTKKSKAKSKLIGKRKESDLINVALRTITEDALDSSAENPVEDDKIVIKKGDIVEEIIATAMEEECELIILSSHADSPQEAIVSKTIHDVLRHSKVPVIIIPPMMGMATL